MKKKICISINKALLAELENLAAPGLSMSEAIEGGLCFGIKQGFISRVPGEVTEIRIIPAETALRILAKIKEEAVPA